jgi:hypothetical protein
MSVPDPPARLWPRAAALKASVEARNAKAAMARKGQEMRLREQSTEERLRTATP